MIKAYIFDLVGTLGYHAGDLREVIGDLHKQFLITPFDKIKLPEEQRKKILEYNNQIEVHLYKDSKEVIKKLKKNYKLGLISNLYDLTAIQFEEKFRDFFINFDVVVFSAYVGLKKPDPKIFLQTLEKLGVNPEEAIMIGDSPEKDVIAAQQVGMNALLINRKTQTLLEIL
ncbi:MAG: HAD family hydrolase [Candidatus Nanoarchaeia archaeon]|nr:HAD family hydrolase [Candidatus Nanoarchaeia archaeon]MDD5588267.1 HAD family hydrolase [Candidatus Nanoarchaeia archaeon]